jgi:hypothetical protein
MKRLLLLTAILLTACVGSGGYQFDTRYSSNTDSNGAWVISMQANKMDSWIESKTSSINEVGYFDDKGLIEVENSTALIWTDSYICTHMYGGQRVEFLWEKGATRRREELLMRASDSRKYLWFKTESPYIPSNNNRFLHQLNYYDSLAIQYKDDCGEIKYYEFDISGSHHLTTTQTNTDTNESETFN